ncbi:MAG: glycosidase [Armatimonadetes bacterium]|nr:glycosidase [Armatimonadota bacterium]
MADDVFTRLGDGPLLTPNDMPCKANSVLNPGVVEVDGEMLLLLRVEDKRGVSEIRVARSSNGVDSWRIAERALLQPDLPENPYEEFGCEDARVTQIAEREWIIAYTAYSRYGPAVAMATTKDFETVERLGLVLSPSNKDAAIFPQKYDDRWYMVHRPVTGGGEHVWYACAPFDFVHWSMPGILLPQRGGPWWDGLRVGVGGPPIGTDKGWLFIYHGAKEMGRRPVYRLGVAVIDLEDPRKVLARASDWVFGPEADHENQGLVPGVVFTCGAVCRGDELWMYYGAADTFVGLAVAKTADLVSFAFEHDYLHQIGREKGMVGQGLQDKSCCPDQSASDLPAQD